MSVMGKHLIIIYNIKHITCIATTCKSAFNDDFYVNQVKNQQCKIVYDFFSGPELQVHLICKCLTTIQEKKSYSNTSCM